MDGIFPDHARFVATIFDTLNPEEQTHMRRLLKKLGFAVAAMLDEKT
jgi:hypothetical protein